MRRQNIATLPAHFILLRGRELHRVGPTTEKDLDPIFSLTLKETVQIQLPRPDIIIISECEFAGCVDESVWQVRVQILKSIRYCIGSQW